MNLALGRRYVLQAWQLADPAKAWQITGQDGHIGHGQPEAANVRAFGQSTGTQSIMAVKYSVQQWLRPCMMPSFYNSQQ